MHSIMPSLIFLWLGYDVAALFVDALELAAAVAESA